MYFIAFFTYFIFNLCIVDLIGVTNVIGEDFPHLGASVALTPAEEAVADRALMKTAALGAATLF